MDKNVFDMLPGSVPPSETQSQPLDLSTGRHFNDTAIREHALACSVAIKGGKFTRVGQDFIDEVHADIESIIRDWNNKFPLNNHAPVSNYDAFTFTTGALMSRVQEALNGAIRRLVQRKVEVQPSCGKTLSRTR
jgi:hypothetical protein